MTSVELYRRRCEAAQADLVRALRSTARALTQEANMIESAGCAPGPQSTRADLRELENYLLAYDKASAALAAVEANARAEGER